MFAPVDLYSQKAMLEVSCGNNTCMILVFHMKKKSLENPNILEDCSKHPQPFL